VAGVVGEVDQGVAQLLVAGPAELDHPAPAGGDGDRHRPGERGQAVVVGEPGPHVAELAQQGRGSHAVAGLGQAGEDGRVGVDLQALDDLGLQLAFLTGGDLDGVQQGSDTHHPTGRLGRADPRQGAVWMRPSRVVTGVRPRSWRRRGNAASLAWVRVAAAWLVG
jgi:hypothetical protein